MKYKEFGQEHATALVFIHGGGVGGWMWDGQTEYFASKYHCIVVDMIDYDNQEAGAHFTIASAADQIIALLDSIAKNKQKIVVGFSLGAQVLVAMLAKKPNLINYAMINSALVKPLPFARELVSSMSFMLPLVKLRVFSDLQAKTLYVNSKHLDIYYKENRQMSKATFVDIMSENMSFRIPESFKNTSSNMLVTVGKKERKTMIDSAKSIVNANSNARLVVIENAGHGLPLADPVRFNTMLEEWLTQR